MGGVENYNAFASKLVRRLLVPYYLANILFYPIWFVICHEMNILKYLWNWTVAEPINALLTIFIGTGNGRELILLQMWFLPALIIAEIIFIKLYNRLNKIGTEVFISSLVVCSLFGLFIAKITDLPLGIDVALVVQFFLLVGILIKKFNIIERINLKICVLLMLLLVFEFCLNGRVNMNSRIYGDSFLFYAGGIAGTLLVMKFSALMTGGKIFSLISDCGRQSMMILVLHPIILNVAYEIIVDALNFPAEKIFTDTAVVFFVTVAGVFIPLFVAKKFGRLPVLKYFCA